MHPVKAGTSAKHLHFTRRNTQCNVALLLKTARSSNRSTFAQQVLHFPFIATDSSARSYTDNDHRDMSSFSPTPSQFVSTKTCFACSTTKY
ncbi:hypothetical protein DPMN_037039 [Dreissena polymorpha]|uniref:Uncharacterized protein n=1 Tax=Dreissena polymorpha TaxID=45954 RepID=A0A9D4MCQ3_DREPO|nr:hypothetical protein DPMN_037039 [Dreissena polymorpha]